MEKGGKEEKEKKGQEKGGEGGQGQRKELRKMGLHVGVGKWEGKGREEKRRERCMHRKKI
jgi:hypothetical protein